MTEQLNDYLALHPSFYSLYNFAPNSISSLAAEKTKPKIARRDCLRHLWPIPLVLLLARLNIYAREPGIPRWKTATQALLAYVCALSPPLKGDHVTYRPIRAQYENQPGVTSQERQNRNRVDVSDLVRVRVYAIVPNGILS